MAEFILVAGTFHGGWYWNPIKDLLLQEGHIVHAPSLTGLEGPIESKSINLETHIQDILNIIENKKLTEVILVGWSYGGMVITGVADRNREKISKLIYLDAQLPTPSQREWDLLPSKDQATTLDQCLDGLNIFPNDWLREHEPRVHPHPLATKLQPLDYDQKAFDQIEKIFVFAEKWFHNPESISPIRRSYEQAQRSVGWETLSWPFGHDLVRECPEMVVELLLHQAEKKATSSVPIGPNGTQ